MVVDATRTSDLFVLFLSSVALWMETTIGVRAGGREAEAGVGETHEQLFGAEPQGEAGKGARCDV